MKFPITLGLSFALGLVLSLLPVQFYRPHTDSILNIHGQTIPVPHNLNWVNFFMYPDFYESPASSYLPSMILAFAPFLLGLQWRSLRAAGAWWKILVIVEGLVLIIGAEGVWLAMTFKHANWMTGYTNWKHTPLLLILPGYGILTGITCLIVPWSASFRELLVRSFAG